MRVVVVHGNKGGVGKSLVSVNLALELQGLGCRVGLLDADVDSPYLAEILGSTAKIGLDKDRQMVPVDHRGLRVMSFAMWMPDSSAGVSMKGGMHERWILDALLHSDWGDTEVLVADLPAGSSGAYLGLLKTVQDRGEFLGIVAVAQANVVSALERVWDTAAFHHFRILGVVENMAGEVYGSGRVAEFCVARGLKFFGSIPLAREIREGHEKGEPRLPVAFRGATHAAAVVVAREAGVKVVLL